MSNTISPTSSATDTSALDNASSRVPIQTLGQNDFLKLLTTQMTAQDPMNPQTDTQFIAQMAQFSALEQSKSMQSEMANMQANGLLGKTVDLQVSSDLTVRGTVTAVQIEAGTPKLIVNGQKFEVGQVINISSGTADTLPKLNTYARIS